jgi:RNA polymerase sigma factor (sigma-70 family)
MTTNELIESHLPLANKIAGYKKKGLPRSVQLDELQSAAYFGLVDAAHKYEPERCDNFEGYAKIRIHGAIQDYLRELGWGTRQAPQAHKTLEYEPSAPPSADSPELFGLVLPGLTPPRQAVIRGYFLEDKTQEEIGVEMGLSKARVCQVLGESYEQLRGEWSKERLYEEVA